VLDRTLFFSSKTKMVNAWVQHIKQFAAKKKVPYGCALSDPACRASYKSKKVSATQLLDDLDGVEETDYAAMHAFLEKKLKRSSTEVAEAAVLKKFGYV